MNIEKVKNDFANLLGELLKDFSDEVNQLEEKIDNLEKANSEKDNEIQHLKDELREKDSKLKGSNKEKKELNTRINCIQKQYDESIRELNSYSNNKPYTQLYYGSYLLIISLIYENESNFIDILKSISNITNKNLNNDEAILSMCKMLLEKLNYENKLNLYSYLDNYSIENIKDSLLQKLKELVKQNIGNSCIEDNKTLYKVKKDIIESYMEYQLISRKKLVCVMDQCDLKLKQVSLALFYNKKCESIIEWTSIQAYVCEKCNRLYLIDEQVKKLNNKLLRRGVYKQVSYNNRKMTMREYNIKNNPNVFLNQINKTTQAELTRFNQSNTNLVKNEVKDDIEVQIMKTVAPELIKMRYSINIPRQTRWCLLRDKIIPELGLAKTKAIFFNLVCYDGSIKKPKLAEEEWSYDYNKLKNK